MTGRQTWVADSAPTFPDPRDRPTTIGYVRVYLTSNWNEWYWICEHDDCWPRVASSGPGKVEAMRKAVAHLRARHRGTGEKA